MKNSFLLLLAIVVFFASCNRVPPPGSNSLLSTAKLETTSYTIDISKDNTIIGKQGAVINIPAGSIASDTGLVTLDLVEVYSIQDMVKAGLTTQSNGIPLISEGIIFIGSTHRAEVITTISAYIPAAQKQKGMNVYTGYADHLGNLNWRNPGPLKPYVRTEVADSVTPLIDITLADTLLTPAGNGMEYYHFSTTELGWYSVGKVTKGIPGFEQSHLEANIKGEYKGQLHIYLVIPSENLFLIGGPAKGKQNTYAFFTDDSKILLPYNKQAYILAMAEQDANIVYGISEFTTAQSQNIEVLLQPMSKEQFDMAIKVL